jgi:hypothetical protein
VTDDARTIHPASRIYLVPPALAAAPLTGDEIVVHLTPGAALEPLDPTAALEPPVVLKAIPVKTIRKVPCEVYSRVVGYFRPVQNWNLGKRAEFADRVTYSATKSIASFEDADRRAKLEAIVNGEEPAAGLFKGDANETREPGLLGEGNSGGGDAAPAGGDAARPDGELRLSA